MSTARGIRWGVLGTGTIAGKFATALARTEQGRLHAVASRSPGKAGSFAAAHGFARAHDDYAALLDDGEVEAIYVATPTLLHLEHCTMALERGLPVLCEKPLAMTRAEGERIVARAREAGVFCMEAMWMRFHPLVCRLREWIGEGRLGQPSSLQASLGWAKERERVERPELGRGAMLDFGVYPLSLAQYLLGHPDEVDVEVRRHASGVDEWARVRLRYPGCVATLEASVCERLSNDALVVGSRASARLAPPLLAPSSLALLEGGPLGRWLGRARASVAKERFPADIGLRLEAEELMRCVAAGRCESEVVPLADSLEVLEWIDRVRGPQLTQLGGRTGASKAKS